MAASAAVGSYRAPLRAEPWRASSPPRSAPAPLRCQNFLQENFYRNIFSWLNFTFLNLFLYNFFLAELTGRAPRELRNTKTFRTPNPPNANHGRLTVLEPPDRVLGR